MAADRLCSIALVSVLAAVLLCSSMASASDFTAGMTIDTYRYYFNVTSYANVTIDLKDMLLAINANNYAEAETIYVNGKNAWRNLATKNPRNAKPVLQRNYTTALGHVEPWYLMSALYFSDTVDTALGVVNASLYIDKPISDALAGINDFHPTTGRFAAYRHPMLTAYLKAYPTIYYSHEIDAGWTALMGDPTKVRTGHSETDHGVGCYTGVTPASTERKTVRVAPGYTPWEQSEEVGKFWCTTGQLVKGSGNKIVKETTSQVNLQFLALSKRIQNLFVLADGSAPPRVDPSALLALRLDQLRNININQIQLTLQAVYQAANGNTCTKTNKECKAAHFGAEAYAHWRLAQAPLNYMGVSKAALQNIEALLNPTVWRAAATREDSLRTLFRETVLAIKDATDRAGYLWSSIASCKLTAKQIVTLSTGSQGATAASSADVADAAVAATSVVDAGAVAVAADVGTGADMSVAAAASPVAAAMAALMSQAPNADGSGAGFLSEAEMDALAELTP